MVYELQDFILKTGSIKWNNMFNLMIHKTLPLYELQGKKWNIINLFPSLMICKWHVPNVMAF